MKNWFIPLCAAALTAAGCHNHNAGAPAETAEETVAVAAPVETKAPEPAITVADLPEEPVFDIVTNMGTIKVKLYRRTPKHRENFARLALAGFYDSLLFHRVIQDFMIQGGDPYTRDTAKVALYGQGGPDYQIPAEFIPEYRHKKGALAAARRGDAANPKKESSGSQFYIVQNPEACSHLDGDYTVFGETVAGLDVVDRIAAVRTDRHDLPLQEVRILKVKLDEASRPKVEKTE